MAGSGGETKCTERWAAIVEQEFLRVAYSFGAFVGRHLNEAHVWKAGNRYSVHVLGDEGGRSGAVDARLTM